jgi:glycosyl transferase, family 25
MNSDSDKPFDYFERIYCINLDSRPERWISVQAEFLKLGIKDRVERISGVVCEDPREGFARAHLKVIALAKELNLSNCFIFEDDLWIIEENMKSLPPAIRELGKLDWDLFYIGGTTVAPAYQISPFLTRTTGIYATQSYAINACMYDILLNSWHPSQIYDVFLAKEIAPVYQCYLTIPLISYQKTGFSDIEHRIVDYKTMMDKNYARDLVRGVDGRGGLWRLPSNRIHAQASG